MKPNHSPFPWTYKNGGIWAADGFLVAAINGLDDQHIQPKGFAKANGRLLAAAPELHHVLTDVKVWLMAPDTSAETLAAMEIQVKAALRTIKVRQKKVSTN